MVIDMLESFAQKAIDNLKIKTGRKLTTEEMKLAEAGTEDFGPTGIAVEDYTGPFVNLSKKDGTIFKCTIEYELASTPDASKGDRLMHTNYYRVEAVDESFDENGLLIKRKISTELPMGQGTGVREFTYLPAGSFRWHTKKVTRY